MIGFILEIPFKKAVTTLAGLFIKKPVIGLEHNNLNYQLILWGDPIGDEEFIKNHDDKIDEQLIVNNIYGHYYYVLLDKKQGTLIIGNSLFSLLPLYYSEVNGRLIFSNNAFALGEYLGLNNISRKFILETMLFNYPLFNQSIIENIMLVPSNSCIKIDSGSWRISKHTGVENWFSADPLSWRKSADMTSSLFLEIVKRYLPAEKYFSSLTGGFDSRTLVSAGLLYGKDFSCYSFGSAGSKDTEIPEELSEKAGLSYVKILLDQDYVESENLNNGLEFVYNASGTASFARAHYLYAAKTLGIARKYIITGNFGSELLRAVHVRGVVFSPNLVTLYNCKNPDKALGIIENSREMKFVNMKRLSGPWDQLKQELSGLSCYDSNYGYLTKNQRFYVFVFEEVFRKYFGAEMVNQFNHVKNRTPYLDIDFMKHILSTKLAGIYSDFFEHNPFWRYKGQVLYAHIVKKAYPLLGEFTTDKWYSPVDLLTKTGKFNILKGYLKKKMNHSYSNTDPCAVNQSYLQNRDYYKQIPVNGELFNPAYINDEVRNRPDEQLFRVISLSLLEDTLAGNRGRTMGPSFKADDMPGDLRKGN